jgi:hypothetical protein
MLLRRFLVMFAVLGLLVASSGCSLREVQLYFQFKGHPISADQAKATADLVNRNRPAGCDTRYAPGASYSTPCVPNNVTSVHCAGTTGDGPAVRGPLTVTGWDAFGLDPDGDKQACVDPVGSADVMGQVLDQVEVAGWAFDPNTTDPINVDIYDNAVGSRFTASDSRTDIGAAFPGAGDNHGFDVTTPEDIGTTHKICAYGINIGAGGNQSFGCKTITMQDIGEYTDSTWDVVGMIEGADRVPDGIHVRGFVFADPGPSAQASYFLTTGPPAPSAYLNDHLKVARPDVHEALDEPGTAPVGFDFNIPTFAGTPFYGATNLCLDFEAGTAAQVQLMCRPIDS